MIDRQPYRIFPSTAIGELPARCREFQRQRRAQGLDCRRHFYTYGIGFHTGIVKVGFTEWPDSRIQTIRGEGLRQGYGTATAFWVSPPRIDQDMARRAEGDLLAALRAEASTIGPAYKEWFSGITLERTAILADATDWGEVAA